MSYSLSISGHKDFSDPAEARQFEEQVAEKARALVEALDGVTVAAGSFGIIGQQDLKVQE